MNIPSDTCVCLSLSGTTTLLVLNKNLTSVGKT